MESFSAFLMNMWDAFIGQGATVIILKVLLLAAAGLVAFFFHRY